MTIMMIIETIDTAILNLRFITRGRVSVDKLITQLETLKAVIPISPDEAMATCLSFRNDLLPLADIDGLAEDIYLIGFEIYIAIKGWYDGNKYAWRADRKNWDRGDVEPVCVGRWESRGGKHFVELWWGRYDYYYCSCYGGGSVCNPNMPVESAVLVIQAKLDRGCFLPDKAVVPMRRVV